MCISAEVIGWLRWPSEWDIPILCEEACGEECMSYIQVLAEDSFVLGLSYLCSTD